jgi:BirA family biotin operon repressor/biotin-[acetyl-CoA-carboxylase] ligase
MSTFDVAKFQHRRKGAFGSQVFYYDEIDSTNRVAETLARQNQSEGTIVLANLQSMGKGRNTNQWFSPKDVNLYCTLVLKPSRENLHRIPFIAGLAIAQALSAHDLSVDLKWPNDVLIGERKIAGVLVQSAIEGDVLQYAIVGIGINVNVTDFPAELLSTATSIALEKAAVQREQLLANLLFEFEELYGKMNLTSWDDFSELIAKHSSYLQNCHVEIKTTDGVTEGTTAGLDPFGGLILKTVTGQVVIYSGEVKACRKKQPAF